MCFCKFLNKVFRHIRPKTSKLVKFSINVYDYSAYFDSNENNGFNDSSLITQCNVSKQGF